MSYHHNRDNNLVILDLTNNAVISNQISPKFMQVTSERFAECSWLICCQNTLFKIMQNPFLDGRIKFEEIFFSILLESKLPFNVCHFLKRSMIRFQQVNKFSHLVQLFHNEQAQVNNLLDPEETLQERALYNSFWIYAFLWTVDQGVFLNLQKVGQRA